jgi:hypothetical protein
MRNACKKRGDEWLNTNHLEAKDGYIQPTTTDLTTRMQLARADYVERG